MKKTTKLDKLKLNAETIRPLTSDDLKRVAGGLGTTTAEDTGANDTTRYTCSQGGCSNR